MSHIVTPSNNDIMNIIFILTASIRCRSYDIHTQPVRVCVTSQPIELHVIMTLNTN